MIAIVIGIILAVISTIFIKKEANGEVDWYVRTERRIAVLLSILFAVIVAM